MTTTNNNQQDKQATMEGDMNMRAISRRVKEGVGQVLGLMTEVDGVPMLKSEVPVFLVQKDIAGIASCEIGMALFGDLLTPEEEAEEEERMSAYWRALDDVDPELVEKAVEGFREYKQELEAEGAEIKDIVFQMRCIDVGERLLDYMRTRAPQANKMAM